MSAAVALTMSAVLATPADFGTAESVVDAARPMHAATLSDARADEGLTVVERGGSGTVLTRGNGSIPRDLRSAGWVHVGDPDSYGGMIVDAFQGASGATAKLFTVTYPGGRRVDLVHPLAAGESYHNSFVTVSPDGRWLVAGEWGTVRRLLVFRMPATGARAARRVIPLAGVITLRHPVRDVQGCDFASARELLCSTDDQTTSLFPVARQLLALHLDHPLDGTPVRAGVRLVDSIPAQDVCAGGFGEVEGIDVTGGVVRVAVNAPCAPTTEIFTYGAGARWHRADDVDSAVSWGDPRTAVDLIDPATGEVEARRRRSGETVLVGEDDHLDAVP